MSAAKSTSVLGGFRCAHPPYELVFQQGPGQPLREGHGQQIQRVDGHQTPAHQQQAAQRGGQDSNSGRERSSFGHGERGQRRCAPTLERGSDSGGTIARPTIRVAENLTERMVLPSIPPPPPQRVAAVARTATIATTGARQQHRDRRPEGRPPPQQRPRGSAAHQTPEVETTSRAAYFLPISTGWKIQNDNRRRTGRPA